MLLTAISNLNGFLLIFPNSFCFIFCSGLCYFFVVIDPEDGTCTSSPFDGWGNVAVELGKLFRKFIDNCLPTLPRNSVCLYE